MFYIFSFVLSPARINPRDSTGRFSQSRGLIRAVASTVIWSDNDFIITWFLTGLLASATVFILRFILHTEAGWKSIFYCSSSSHSFITYFYCLPLLWFWTSSYVHQLTIIPYQIFTIFKSILHYFHYFHFYFHFYLFFQLDENSKREAEELEQARLKHDKNLTVTIYSFTEIKMFSCSSSTFSVFFIVLLSVFFTLFWVLFFF